MQRMTHPQDNPYAIERASEWGGRTFRYCGGDFSRTSPIYTGFSLFPYSDLDIVPLYALETFIDFSLKGLTSAVESGLSKEALYKWCIQKYPLFN
ncbi:hypothetical protein TNIN_191431 [Trichonephila inaurata madagascariensis]|uniref:Uncharacterized protein n=1 Tax=Trichonephila inaurata madagascariensis TaxID=2747483 RepID=A0A8X6J3L8_9ARAC|nr:hypothetical protein TNIN_191431 [Trichonephila inaurata madagascariensis]